MSRQRQQESQDTTESRQTDELGAETEELVSVFPAYRHKLLKLSVMPAPQRLILSRPRAVSTDRKYMAVHAHTRNPPQRHESDGMASNRGAAYR